MCEICWKAWHTVLLACFITSSCIKGLAAEAFAAPTKLPWCLQALADVHRHGFIHRDVKTENFCLNMSGSNDTIKIIDFGFARVAYGEPFASCGQIVPAAAQLLVVCGQGTTLADVSMTHDHCQLGCNAVSLLTLLPASSWQCQAMACRRHVTSLSHAMARHCGSPARTPS